MTPTRSPTLTITPNWTATITPTRTNTPNYSPTPTFTWTPTSSPTYTITPLPTKSFTTSPTPTFTPTVTPTVTTTRVNSASLDYVIQNFSFVDTGNKIWTFTPANGVTPKCILFAYLYDDTLNKIVRFIIAGVSDTDVFSTNFPYTIALSSTGKFDYHHDYYKPGNTLHVSVGYLY